MSKPQLLRATLRAISPRVSYAGSTRVIAAQSPVSAVRRLSVTPRLFQKDTSKGDLDAATTAGEPGESGDHEGQFARTDESVRVKYPDEKDLPSSRPVKGRGGAHFKPTLATFSLEGRVAVVTGGARGLGLVMAQALTDSGADVAIVDLNSKLRTLLHVRSHAANTIVLQKRKPPAPPPGSSRPSKPRIPTPTSCPR